MKAKQVLTIILPNIQAMMSGVWRIDRAHDLVKLTYTNGATEAGAIPLKRWAKIHENPFTIISEIQEQRKGTTQ